MIYFEIVGKETATEHSADLYSEKTVLHGICCMYIVNLNEVNVYEWLQNKNNVYVGRWSKKCPVPKKDCKWGNRFKLSDGYSRQEAVQLYREDLLSNKQLLSSLGELTGKVLGCWCWPETCHAEVLYTLANHPVQTLKMAEETTELSIDQKLNLILNRLEKLEGIDNAVSAIGERLTKIENLVAETRERLTLANQVAIASEKANEVEKTAKYMSDNYDKLVVDIGGVKNQGVLNKTEIANIWKENALLKSYVNNLKNELDQSNQARNREQQYHRTSLNIKLCGVPTQEGEEESKDGPSNAVTREVIDTVCKTVGITIKKDAIDVCHRLGKHGLGPIIIRFATKNARFDFVKQGQVKLKDLKSDMLDFSRLKKRVPPANVVVTRNRGASDLGASPAAPQDETNRRRSLENDEPTAIYLQEHLTQYNKDLLKETRDALQRTHKYPAYVKNGEVRAKVNENSKYVVINCRGDYQRELAAVTNTGNEQS